MHPETNDSERLQRILRGISGGTDPARLLNEVLAATLVASKGSGGMLLGLVDGNPVPLATSGPPPNLLLEVAEACIEAGRLVRRIDRATGASAAAEAVRVGDRVVGALAVTGEPFAIELSALPLYGSVAGLVLSRRPQVGAGNGITDALDALATLYSEPDRHAVVVHLFDVAERLFGARGGFCALNDGDQVRVAHHRNLDRDRLREASRHPAFPAFVTSPTLHVSDATDPVVARLVEGVDVAVGIPLLIAGGRSIGHLVLVLADEPEPTVRSQLSAFGRHAALALRAAELYADVGDTEERLAAVVHSMPNPVLVVGESGCFSVINASAASVFELSEAFEIGQPVEGRLGHAGLESMLTGGREGHIEVVLGTPAARVFRASVRKVLSPESRVLGRVLVLDDITAERETEQIKNDFVSVIGHELRTPITIAKSSVRALERNPDMAADTRERTMASLTRGIARLERLVEDLLLVSAVEQNSAKLERQPADLGVLVDEFASERVAVRRPRRIDLVQIDVEKIRQVVHHLVDNAVKYSDEDVLVEVTEAGEEVQITVTDRGQGIYSGDIPFLFERFKQLDGSATRAHGGTGLGLFLCRRLVEAHGGRIWCESRIGQGSRFHVALPHQPVSAWQDEGASRP